MLEPVLEGDQHPVALADAQAPKAAGRGRGARVELGVGEPASAVHHGLGLGAPERGAGEELPEGHGISNTLPLFFRSSTYCTAARASLRGNARSITGSSRPAVT